MLNFAQVFARPKKASRQSRPRSLRVPPLTLRRVTWARISFSDPLVWSGISGRSSTISSSALFLRNRLSVGRLGVILRRREIEGSPQTAAKGATIDRGLQWPWRDSHKPSSFSYSPQWLSSPLWFPRSERELPRSGPKPHGIEPRGRNNRRRDGMSGRNP